MAVLPTVDQFPSFVDTHNWLAEGSCQCIWYLPDKRRCCLVRLQKDENHQALGLATKLLQQICFTDPSLQTLAEIAERSCCGRHHRNKIWGSKLANNLAFRWQSELRSNQPAATQKTEPPIKSEHITQLAYHAGRPQMDSAPTYQTTPIRRECIPRSGYDVGLPRIDPTPIYQTTSIKPEPLSQPVYNVGPSQRNTTPAYQAPRTRSERTMRSSYGVGPSHTEPTLMRQAPSNVPTHQPPEVVAFAKHVVWKGETLASSLLSPIEPSKSTSGTVYIFTYTGKAFQEMLKIGYTKAHITYRLEYWATCGHGSPKLLKSYYRVYHPERVELLTHFELEEYWYAMRWCNFHKHSHIEWFKVALSTADRIVKTWILWMNRANPYNRREKLRPFWKGIVDFLVDLEIKITAELMMQIQEADEGQFDLTGFLDSLEAEALRKQYRYQPKLQSTPKSETLPKLEPLTSYPTRSSVKYRY